MRVLVGFEYSGKVRDAFIRNGHEAISCDLLPTERPGPHYQGDIFDIIYDGWDAAILFPTCTFLCNSGLHRNKNNPEREAKTEAAVKFVKRLIEVPIEFKAIENPIGRLSTTIGKPTQIIQPYNFGEDASKATCLWLYELPKLINTKYVEPRIVNGKKRWSNQTDSGQNNLAPSENRGKIRSETYGGISDAMGNQWGNFLHCLNL